MEAAPASGESDEQVVARFQGGDESAFDELVRRHRRAAYRLAHRLTGGHADADDIAQEAFLRAYRSLGRFRGEASFRTWLTRIVMNLAFNARQARRADAPIEEARLEARDEGAAPAETLLRGQVRAAVGALPPRQRQVLVLKVYEGLKFIEIAEAAGISTGTAKATFFQAVQGLKKRLLRAPAGPAPGEGVER